VEKRRYFKSNHSNIETTNFLLYLFIHIQGDYIMAKLSCIIMLALCSFAYSQNTQGWAVSAGGEYDDSGQDIAVDNLGNIYITGYCGYQADFGSTTLIGNNNKFIAKQNAQGDWLWAKGINLTGSYTHERDRISIDNNGYIYITGFFDDTVTIDTITLSCYGVGSIFCFKIDPYSNCLWAVSAGGTDNDYIISRGISSDSFGNSYVTGYYEGTPSFGPYTLTNSGMGEIFVAKIDTNGIWQWAKRAQGSFQDYSYAIATDIVGNSYITGYYQGQVGFGSHYIMFNGIPDIFVAKIDTNGVWQWAKGAGSSNDERGQDIAIDSCGNCYVTGLFEGTVAFGSTSLTSSGNKDVFIAKLDANGNWLWAKKAGGSSNDYGNQISVDSSGCIFSSGTCGANSAFGPYVISSSGSYLSKIDTNGEWLMVKSLGNEPSGICNDTEGIFYMTGAFGGTLDTWFDFIHSLGSSDVFVIKFPSASVDLVSPNGGEYWHVSSQQTIYWLPSFNWGHVDILLSTNNGAEWIYLNPSPIEASLCQYTIIVPALSSTQCLIQIQFLDNEIVTDVSDAPFTICSSSTPSLTISAPTSIKLQTNITYNIDWYSFGVDYINLDYSIDSGISWINIVSTLPADIGSFPWTVPDTPAAFCFIRISDANNPYIYDLNDSSFRICSIQVTSPNGTELLRKGGNTYITWTSDQINRVNIEFSSDNGNIWTTIFSNQSSSGSRYWSPLPSVSNQCLIRISDYDESSVHDMSDGTFTIAAIVVTYPSDAGIKLRVGDLCSITWDSSYLPGTVKLELSTNNGSSYSPFATGLDAFTESYNWIVPNSPSTTCRIKITSELYSAFNDRSDNNFTICRLDLTSPNGFETWLPGTTHSITWSSSGVNNVKLDYSINNGGNWIQIIDSVPATSGSYNWDVPDVVSNLCLVKISDCDYNNVFDISNMTFSIRPYLILIAPNGNEILYVNSVYSIIWSAIPEITSVLLDYSVNGGTTWLPIRTTAYPANPGSYNWIVPNNPSTYCMVRVRNYLNSANFDDSDSFFTITQAVLAPIVDFSSDVISGLEPLSAQFSDLSDPGSGAVSSWLWYFGDGESSNEQNPMHVYQNDGLYTVSLTVTNSYGLSDELVRSDYINVLPRYPLLNPPILSIRFGNIYLGSQSDPYLLLLKNTGTATLTITSVSFQQINSPFSVPSAISPIEIAEGDSVMLSVVFTPQHAVTVSDSLLIHCNSVNLPEVSISLTGTGIYVPPAPPENVAIMMDGYNAIISWDAVTQTIFGTPIEPDYYLIFYNGSSDPENGLYYYLWDTPGLQFTHHLVGLHAQQMFYHVIAYKYYGRGEPDLSGLKPGMAMEEALRLLR
jgi:PKD repeat protein